MTGEPHGASLSALAGALRGLHPRRIEFQQRIQGDGKAQPFAEAFVVRPGVDADQRARLVVQAAAAIARVQRGVGLDHVDLPLAQLLQPKLRNAAAGVRPIEVLGIADGKDLAADHQFGLGLPGSGPAPVPSTSTRIRARSMPSGAIHTTRPGWAGWPMSLTCRRPSGRPPLALVDSWASKFRIDDVPVGDDQGRAVLDLQDHARADARAAQQTAADFRFHQGIGADAAGDGGGHVVQGVGIGLELVEADGEMTAGAIVDGEKNDPAHGVGQTEQDAGHGQPRAALAGMMDSAQRQAAQEDGNQPRHDAKQRNAGHSRRSARRWPGETSGGVRRRSREPAELPGKYEAGTTTGRGGGWTRATSSTVIRNSG